MIDKEKQIAEMAKDIFDCNDALNGIDFAFGYGKDSHFERIAKKLTAIGYRKIPDGAVVVSHSEIEKGDDYADLSELITEFDTMDYLPNNLCKDLFAEAKDFQKRLSALIIRTIARANDAEVKAMNSKEQVRQETAMEILSKLKVMLIERFDYFGELRNKNLKADNNDNVLFDLGQMDCINCILDKIKELVKKYGVEVNDEREIDRKGQ